ncbi:YCF48-related protein [Calditrichota bacterium]
MFGKILIGLFISINFIFAQTGWYWQQPLPPGNSLNDVHVFDPNTLIAVGDFGTIMKSNDGGVSWYTRFNVGNSNDNFNSLSFVDYQIGYAVTDHGRVFKTGDGGNTWSLIKLFHTSYDLTDVHFVDNLNGWVTWGWYATGGILHTQDGGVNWIHQNVNNFGHGTGIFMINKNVGWACTPKGSTWNGSIYKTINGGSNWNVQLDGAKDELNAILFLNADTGFVVGGSGAVNMGIILKTVNGGLEWNQKSIDVGYKLHEINFSNPELGYTVGEYWNGFEKAAIAFRSETEGETWKQLNWPNHLPALKSVKFTNNQTGYMVGEGGTILKNILPDSNWNEVTNSSRLSLEDIYFYNTNLGWAAGGFSTASYPDYAFRGKILKTTDGGNNWVCKFDTNYYFQSLYFINADTGWAIGNFIDSIWQSIIFKTIDGGENWESFPDIFDYKLSTIYFQDYYNGWTVGRDGAMYKSSDGGYSWQIVTAPPYRDLTDIQFTDHLTGYAVITFDQGSTQGEFIKTTDGGQNWILYDTGTWGLNSMFFINNNLGWSVGDNGNIIKTTNGGDSWFNKNSPTGEELNEVYFINSNIGWAVGDKGKIIKTYNGGENWFLMQSNTANDLKSVYFTDQTNGWTVGKLNTILSTNDGGGPILKIQKDNHSGPKSFELFQNHPNPFNSTTTISFYINKPGFVKLSLFNTRGQLIETILSEFKNIGFHQVDWNASQFSSGIYFYTINFQGEFKQSKKLLLIK